MTFPRQLSGIDPELIDLEASVYNNIQDCDLDHLPADVDIMKDDLIGRNAKIRISVFTNCMKQIVANPKALTDTCRQLAMTSCKSKSVVLMKVVRGTMDAVSLYLSRLKSTAHVKIIHLMRDPRGSINSRLRTGWTGFKELDLDNQVKMIHSICERMYRDVTLRRKLEEKYPNVFLQIKYEDLTNDPIKMFQQIYDFIGEAQFPESLKKKLLVSKTHSRRIAALWKITMSKTIVDVVVNNCESILNHLKHDTFSSNK
ncbi:unnamed protein product [Owenia fusiformis]|uniref:Sulfotransferase n=2 Tax=Owenia fusiformis TaxID=6347 RepID=A0A8S4PJ54_OWEFU|nr:unnamed protein product [Owenia fusiformis]